MPSTESFRRIATVSLIGIALLGGTTACSYAAPQLTQEEVTYSFSDGIRLDVGSVQLRNILFVSEGANKEARVLGGLINTADQDVTVTIKAGTAQAQVRVPAKETILLNNDTPPVLLPRVTQPPGALQETTFTVNPGNAQTANVPVLDGTLPEYKTYLPGSPAAEPHKSGAPEDPQAEENSAQNRSTPAPRH